MTKNHPILTSFLLAAGLLAGCSTDTPEIQPAQPEITMRTEVRPMTQRIAPRRTTTYDNTTNLQAEDLRIDAYFHGTATKYLNGATLHYNASAWQFWDSDADAQLHYYWPVEGSVYDPAGAAITVSTLDFVGYCPYETPSYIADLTYDTDEHNVTFACTNLPMTDTEQEDLKEFMFAMALEQNKTNVPVAGVSLTFRHPFARIKMQLAASHPDITINTITFKTIKNNGSYDLSASPEWTLSGDATNLVFGDTTAFTLNVAAQQIGNDLIVIPQEWAGEIEVNASWNDWGDTPVAHALSTTVSPITWQAGYSYTYTFNISPEDLTVNVNNFTEQW
ncbi:MAG: fimbrillin family protein [Paludibacteraceae bacterium]|nr:fimbrillin family protein [Paludibacteraceae bacterium]